MCEYIVIPRDKKSAELFASIRQLQHEAFMKFDWQIKLNDKDKNTSEESK